MARGEQKRTSIARRGLMFVLSSPSGAGKTTLSRMLLKADRDVELSVSVTTRPKRRGEIDGRDYHFIDRARFEAMVKTGKLLEWAEVFGHCYGTPRRPVEKALRAGRDVLFDIDWQGTQQLAKKRATIWSASSSCRPRPRNWSGGSNAAHRTAATSSARAWPRLRAR